MNGVEEVQSSSMVQQRNGLMMSSPVGRIPSMDEEQIATILECNDAEQEPFAESAPAHRMTPETSSLSTSIPNRVLSEIPLGIANSQSTTAYISKQPIENQLRDTGITNHEVG